MKYVQKLKKFFTIVCLAILFCGLSPVNTDLLTQGYKAAVAQEAADPSGYTFYDDIAAYEDASGYTSASDPAGYTFYSEDDYTSPSDPVGYTFYSEDDYTSPADPGGYTFYSESDYTSASDPTGYTFYSEDDYTSPSDPAGYTFYSEDDYTTPSDPTGYTFYEPEQTTPADPTGYTFYPTPAPRPERTFYTDFECEGTSQVYYRFYNDGGREATGRVVRNSPTCGYYPPERPTGTTTPSTPGGSTSTPTTSSRTFYTDYECIGTTQVYFRFYNDGTRQETGRRIERSPSCGYFPPERPTTTTPVTTTTSRNYYVDYECAGTTQVYYRFYNDGTRQETGRRVERSRSCGYFPTTTVSNPPSGGSSTSTPRPTPTPSPTTRYPSLFTSCVVTPANPREGDEVTWRALPTGGSGDFSYRWIGGNSPLVGNSDNPARVRYNSDGFKSGEVRVFDNITRNEAFATCQVFVENRPASSTPTPSVIPTPTPSVTPTPTFSPTPTPTSSPTITPTPTPSPAASVTVILTSTASRCPEGTVEKSRTANEVVCERQTTSTVTTVNSQSASTQPAQTIQVVDSKTTPEQATQTVTTLPVSVVTQETSSIKELPKTGLPLVGVGLGSLLPLGLRLRRVGKNGEETSATSIWFERQLKSTPSPL